MSDTIQSNLTEKSFAQTAVTSRHATTDQSESFRIGDKIVRIDSMASKQGPSAHVPFTEDQQVVQDQTPQARWQDAIGTIEMGLGNIVQNDQALQQAKAEMQSHRAKVVSVRRPLDIQPAWEVEYFRWPRLSRRLLKAHRELFDTIGGQLLSELQPTQSRIGVCSTFPREGKTTIATCLARWSALSGRRTLLIDADVEKPTMTAISGLDCAFGWQAILDADIPASETMIRSTESGLVFMPSRTERSPLMVEKSLAQLSVITFQMKYEFDVVVVDMGNIDNVCAHGKPDMDVVDAMLVTRDPSQTSVGQAMDTRNVLSNLGVRKTFVAQNFARRDVA